MKWAIVNCDTKQVFHIYESEEINYKLFGGDWGNKKKCHHLPVHEDAIGMIVTLRKG